MVSVMEVSHGYEKVHAHLSCFSRGVFGESLGRNMDLPRMLLRDQIPELHRLLGEKIYIIQWIWFSHCLEGIFVQTRISHGSNVSEDEECPVRSCSVEHPTSCPTTTIVPSQIDIRSTFASDTNSTSTPIPPPFFHHTHTTPANSPSPPPP